MVRASLFTLLSNKQITFALSLSQSSSQTQMPKSVVHAMAWSNLKSGVDHAGTVSQSYKYIHRAMLAVSELTIIPLNPYSLLSLSRRKKKCVRVNEEEDDRAGKANDNVSLPCTCDVYVVFVPSLKLLADGLRSHLSTHPVCN